MALINCPECQKEVSDTVKACPNCGAQVQKLIKQRIKAEKKAIAKQRNRKAFKIGFAFLAIMIVYNFFRMGDTDTASDTQSNVAHSKPAPVPTASKVDMATVCKAVTASQMQQDFKRMSSSKNNSKYYVTYTSSNDGSKRGIYCWPEGNRIVWQTDGRNDSSNNGKPGRVRNGEYDEYITYKVQGNTLVINTKFIDGSSKSDKYPLPNTK
jgi:endogenous inhibitor of DNA gyrase (YacG/DUF329 family)